MTELNEKDLQSGNDTVNGREITTPEPYGNIRAFLSKLTENQQLKNILKRVFLWLTFFTSAIFHFCIFHLAGTGSPGNPFRRKNSRYKYCGLKRGPWIQKNDIPDEQGYPASFKEI